jgi:sugar phosphate isomerase/epimerase
MLLESCDPELLKMELDLCWIAAAQHDPLAYFEKHPGRFPLVHVKQMKKVPVRTSENEGLFAFFEKALPDITEVGEGVVDWADIFPHSAQAGIQHFFVEHDDPQMPFASIEKSYQYLQNLRF